MQQNTLDLPSSGITRKERYTFTCLDTYQKPYYDSTIRNQRRSVAPQYGAKIQYTPDANNSPPLNKEATKYKQAVAGTLLYYGRAVHNTILPALSATASEQAQPTERTKEILTQLLDYCATQEEAIITYSVASKMILAVHSDAGYCNEKKSRSRAGGHFSLSNDDEFLPNNRAILTVATILKAVMSSAVEAELGALYLNAKEAVYIQQILTKMGHLQPKYQSKQTT
jgi:hypothetical protein